MKLLKHFMRLHNGKKYYKFTVVIPSRMIKQLRWKGGEQLSVELKGEKLIIKKG